MGDIVSKNMPIYPQSIMIQWYIKNNTESGVFSTKVYRSGGMEGPWELIAENLTNTYAYVDRLTTSTSELKPNLLNFFKNLYYKIEITTPSGKILQSIEETGPTVTGKMAGYQRKLNRDQLIQFKKYNGSGNKMIILKRKLWGEYCKRCYDVKSKEIMRTSCKLCWGTGIIGGYWNPISTYGRRAPTGGSSQITPEQKSDASDVKIWTIDVPGLDQDDLVVFLVDNKRYKIDTTAQTEIQFTAVGQVANAHEINHDNILMQLPVYPETAYPLF